jgi:uncharacterized membrane protein
MSTRKIAFAAVIGAAYAALTMLLAPISYGPVQFRIAEVLCILPFFFPFSVWGLFVGCVIANLLSAYGALDIVFGSLATLFAALTTMSLGKTKQTAALSKVLACLPPVVFNALIVGAVIAYGITSVPGSTEAFWPTYTVVGLQVGAGELGVLYVIGLPLLFLLPKTGLFRSLSAIYHEQ